MSLGPCVREVHDNELTILAFVPAPRGQDCGDWNFRAGWSPHTAPLPFPECSVVDDGQELTINGLKRRHGGLGLTTKNEAPAASCGVSQNSHIRNCRRSS
jgi:hypothetical protein